MSLHIPARHELITALAVPPDGGTRDWKVVYDHMAGRGLAERGWEVRDVKLGAPKNVRARWDPEAWEAHYRGLRQIADDFIASGGAWTGDVPWDDREVVLGYVAEALRVTLADDFLRAAALARREP